jgi:hypothetical protein
VEKSQDKSRIFITSTDRALTLARVLGDQLATDVSEAIIWREESDGKCSHDIIEMLINAAKEFDFAVIIITRADLVFREGNDKEARQTLDNCFYEAGLSIAALGADRCFLFSSVRTEELPVDLQGINYLLFHEPADLADLGQCNMAVNFEVKKILESIQKKGRRTRQETLPLLSVEEIFARERHEQEGGQLQEGYVMVCDVEPFDNDQWASQVKQNFGFGINYIYFFQATPENPKKIGSLLKTMLLTDNDGKPSPVEREHDVIRENLANILQSNSLNVYFLKDSPSFRFRIHNAGDPQRARAYLRCGNTPYFVEWLEGVNSKSIWNFFLLYTESRQQQSLFRSNKDFELYEKEKDFLNKLKEEIGDFFPQIKSEIVNRCFQPEEKK